MMTHANEPMNPPRSIPNATGCVMTSQHPGHWAIGSQGENGSPSTRKRGLDVSTHSRKSSPGKRFARTLREYST